MHSTVRLSNILISSINDFLVIQKQVAGSDNSLEICYHSRGEELITEDYANIYTHRKHSKNTQFKMHVSNVSHRKSTDHL